jgi:hypothetical protein
MFEVIGEIVVLAAAIFIGSVAFDWWRKRSA